MVAPVVVSEMVTGCGEVYVPAAGAKVGVAAFVIALMVYFAVATELLV